MKRILVVDDHFMVRLGLLTSLSAEADLEVIGEAGDGDTALRLYEQHRPDLVLMDVRLPGRSGIETAETLCRRFPEARVLMLSTHSEQEQVARALHAGARGYLLKSSERAILLRAVRDVAGGERFLDPSVAPHGNDRFARPLLTEREIEILHLVMKGRANKEIAGTLRIAEVTVKLHVSHVLQKLGAADRAQAVAEAIKRGIVALD